MEYEFWVYSAASAQWSLARGWGAPQTFTWTPLVVGSYAVQAWARQVGSTVAYDTYAATRHARRRLRTGADGVADLERRAARDGRHDNHLDGRSVPAARRRSSTSSGARIPGPG